MAQLPSLALGIGLQGKPIDRAALNLRRAEGEERAALRAQQKAQKELDPYKKRMMDLGNKAYLPVHKNMMADKYAETMKYMVENGDDVDRMKLGQLVFQMESLATVAQKEYNQYIKNVNDKGNSIWDDELKILGTATDPNVINEALQNSFGLSGQVTPDGNFAVQMRKPTTADTFAETIIKSEGNRLWQPIRQGEEFSMGKSDYIELIPREGKVEEVTQAALNNPDVVATEKKLLQIELGNSGVSVDLSDEKEKAAFLQKVNERIANKVRNKFDITNSQRQPKGFNVNVSSNLYDNKDAILNPIEGNIPFKIDDTTFYAQSAGGISYGDKNATVPFTDETFYADGSQANVTGQEGTYNFVAASYTLDKDFTVPETVIIRNRQGEPVELKKGRVFKTGALVPFGFEESAFQNGAEFSPKIVAWAEDSDKEWFYTPAGASLQSRFMTASKANKQLIDNTQREQKKLLDKMGSFNKPSSNNSPKTESKKENQYNLNSNLPKEESNQNKGGSDRRSKAVDALTPEQKKALGITEIEEDATR